MVINSAINYNQGVRVNIKFRLLLRYNFVHLLLVYMFTSVGKLQWLRRERNDYREERRECYCNEAGLLASTFISERKGDNPSSFDKFL